MFGASTWVKSWVDLVALNMEVLLRIYLKCSSLCFLVLNVTEFSGGSLPVIVPCNILELLEISGVFLDWDPEDSIIAWFKTSLFFGVFCPEITLVAPLSFVAFATPWVSCFHKSLCGTVGKGDSGDTDDGVGMSTY